MPQLMPLKWNLSLLMIGFVLIVCYYLYYFKNVVSLETSYSMPKLVVVCWTW